MTVTPPRKRRARHRVASRIAALVATATLVAGLVVPVTAAHASPATPTPTPTAASEPGTTALTLAPIGNGILNPGEGLTVSVTLQNGTGVALAPTSVTLSLGTTALPDRAALGSWLAGETQGVSAEAVGSVALESVEPGGQRTSAISVPADAPALGALAPGVYPIVAEYASGSGTVSSTSVVVVPTGAPMQVSVVVPITAGPRSTALLTAAELAELTSVSGGLTDQLEGVEGTSAILGVDPAIPAAIRVLGVSAPESATAWLERLEGLPNARFALQFGDADPAVQIEAGLSSPLAPTTLAPLMSPVDFPRTNPTSTPTPTATPSPTPTPTAQPEGPVLPTIDELTDIGPTRARIYWPAGDGITPATVQTLGAITVDDDPSYTLLPSTALTSAGSGRADAGDAALVVSDADVSLALSEAAELDESALRGAPLAAASAYLAFASADGATVVAALDRGTDRSNVGLRTAVTTATEFPGAEPQSLSGLLAADADAVEIADADPPAERVGQATALLADEGEISRFATILDEPTQLTGEERAEILQLLGVGWAAIPTQARTAVATHRVSTTTTLESVSLLPSPTINLLAAGAGLPFTVRNDLPYSVNLVLYASPDDLRLNVRRANDIVATPLSNTRVEVPVEARVGNGEVTLDLQLRSPSFVTIGPPRSVEVNVRAEWETVGLVALSIIVGGLVLLGVIRTVLRIRSRRSGRTTDAAPAADGDEDAS
ncbi:MAG: DUF6049 family protein [Microbacterium sp.]